MKYRRRFGDRYDGRLVRNGDIIFKLIPFIMKTRVESQNLFDYEVDITKVEEYIREKRSQGIKKIGLLHVIIAAVVRVISQKPRLNRFIAGQRIYARNEITTAFTIKKKLTEDGEETIVKLAFEPRDTIYDVIEKLNASVIENKQEENQNQTDKAAKFFTLLPRFLLRLAIWVVEILDYHGILPKSIHRASPFHTSVFLTDLGSLGIQPVFHHTYNFGTNSIFISFGAKQSKKVIDNSNNIADKKIIKIRVTADERITDGYYFATAFKMFNSLLQHPERLEVPPERVVEDGE